MLRDVLRDSMGNSRLHDASEDRSCGSDEKYRDPYDKSGCGQMRGSDGVDRMLCNVISSELHVS